jgi:hypothetical protein
MNLDWHLNNILEQRQGVKDGNNEKTTNGDYTSIGCPVEDQPIQGNTEVDQQKHRRHPFEVQCLINEFKASSAGFS